MLRRFVAVVALASLLNGALAGSVAGENLARPCPLSIVNIVAEVRADAADACRGASAAIEFFAALGLKTDEPISIEIMQRLPAPASEIAAGCYLQPQRRILLLTYARFEANRTWFNVPIDRELYQTVATHEVAHALAFCNFRIAKPTVHAAEYIAYVVAFASMSPALREMALAATPGEGFTNTAQISDVIYSLDPMRFAAESYRHYVKPGNGPAFLRAVLAGSALTDEQSP